MPKSNKYTKLANVDPLEGKRESDKYGLKLYNNQIGDEGAKMIAEALREANLPKLDGLFRSENQHSNEPGDDLTSTDVLGDHADG